MLIVNVMHYFSEATDILQQEATPTSNFLIPVIDSLENELLQTNRENAVINAFCERLLSRLRTRFHYLLNSKIYQAATALDPRIKLSFTDNQKEGKYFLFSSSAIKHSIKSQLPLHPPQVNYQPTSPNASSEPTTKKVRLLESCSIFFDSRLLTLQKI